MAFVSQLDAVFVVAGGDTVVGPLHKKPPSKVVLDNLYFDSSVPEFEGAYQVQGNSVKHADVEDGTFVLWKSVQRPSDIEIGDVVAVPVEYARPDSGFDPLWRCLRVVEEKNEDGTLVLSTVSNEERKIQELNAENVETKLVYAFDS